MKVLITKWGLLSFNPQLSFYVDWDFIAKAIQDQPYLISKWFFLNLPNMFKKSYVIYVRTGIQSEKDVKRVIKKLETIEGITIPEEKQQEIMDAVEELFSLPEDEMQGRILEIDTKE